MTAADAYKLILQVVNERSDTELVGSKFYERVFGSFIISFIQDGAEKSVVNDRFELVVCNDLHGDIGCRTVLKSIREADQQQLLNAIELGP